MKRVFTALILIPLVLYVVLWGHPGLVFAVTALVACICYHEFAGIAEAYEFGNPGPLGFAAGLGILWLQPAWGAALLVALAIVSLTWNLRAADLHPALPRTALLLAGVVYVFGCWKFALILSAEGRWWLLYALALSWVGDIGAYYTGRKLGRHRMAPRISPAKSWEGAAASLAVSVLFGYFYLARFIPGVSAVLAIGLSIAANAAAQAGDLAESALKRGAGVKDSGTILPGHGGFLDRVDSTLFVLPVVTLVLWVSAYASAR